MLSHTVKVREQVIECRIRRIVTISANQFGFMPRRPTIGAIYLIRCLVEKYREHRKDLHMVFIDLEKGYDNVSRVFTSERDSVGIYSNHPRYLFGDGDMCLGTGWKYSVFFS